MRKRWNKDMDELLRLHYPTGDLNELASKLCVTRGAVGSRAKKLGIRREVNVKMPWEKHQLDFLREHYADMSAIDIAEIIHHPVDSVRRTAIKLGLAKSDDFLSALGKNCSLHPNSIAKRFRKGCDSSHKGKRIDEFMSAEGIANSSKTRFKKGNVPHNALKVGEDTIRSNGYVYHKTEDGLVLKHHYVWEQANGPIPYGYNVAFRDGNRQNCSLDNLYLMSRSSTVKAFLKRETPEAKAARIAKCLETRRKIVRRDKLRLHWGLEPYSKLVKRW